MTEQEAIEFYNERIALMTIDGEQSEATAAKHAYFELQRILGRGNVPAAIRELARKAFG
jgi:hypothetical protein